LNTDFFGPPLASLAFPLLTPPCRTPPRNSPLQPSRTSTYLDPGLPFAIHLPVLPRSFLPTSCMGNPPWLLAYFPLAYGWPLQLVFLLFSSEHGRGLVGTNNDKDNFEVGGKAGVAQQGTYVCGGTAFETRFVIRTGPMEIQHFCASSKHRPP
jgi:hypothetical protein